MEVIRFPFWGLIISVSLILSLGVGILLGIAMYKKSVSGEMRDLEYYKKTYLCKIGWSEGYGSYRLHSFDGGKNWYAVSRTTENGFVIDGLAKEVFPGLLDHLDGLNNLTKHVKKNGPIDLSGPDADTCISLLEKAGFTVTTKED